VEKFREIAEEMCGKGGVVLGIDAKLGDSSPITTMVPGI
jgi:hypothetical protein